jgi:hypothetical protein
VELLCNAVRTEISSEEVDLVHFQLEVFLHRGVLSASLNLRCLVKK